MTFLFWWLVYSFAICVFMNICVRENCWPYRCAYGSEDWKLGFVTKNQLGDWLCWLMYFTNLIALFHLVITSISARSRNGTR